MRILVTNDDGIDAPGIGYLIEAMTDLGEVVVAAPDREFSGASQAVGSLMHHAPSIRRRSIAGAGASGAGQAGSSSISSSASAGSTEFTYCVQTAPTDTIEFTYCVQTAPTDTTHFTYCVQTAPHHGSVAQTTPPTGVEGDAVMEVWI